MMVYEENDKLIFPTRTGTPQDSATERTMLQPVGAGSTRTQMRSDGDKTIMLRTRDGAPEFSTIDESSSVVVDGRSVLDFMSGCSVGGAFSAPSVVSAVSFTNATAAKFNIPNSFGAWFSSQRLALPLSTALPSPPSGVGYSQMSEVRPYFYTGLMRKLVQYCLGIGRVRHPSWYVLHCAIPSDVRSAYDTGNAATISYNYRYISSHGIARGADGQPWLVWVSQTNGVWVFLLPREINSETAAFQAAVGGDAEAAAITSLFGGFPTGESNVNATLEQWVQSGCAKQVIAPSDMGLYVGSYGVADQLGWAFSYDGSEARAVGVRDVTGPGVSYKTTLYSKITFAIGACRSISTSETAQAVRRSFMKTVHKNPALRAKLLYLTDTQASLVQMGGLAALYSLDATPVATMSATYQQLSNEPCAVGRGQFKVWSDYVQMCVSPTWPTTGLPDLPADSILGVWYAEDNTLVELRCSYGSTGVSGGPFTAQYNTSGSTQASQVIVDDTGEVIRGIKSKAVHTDPGSDHADAYRRAWYTLRTVTTTTTTSHSAKGAAIIPYGDRESVVLAKYAAHNGGSVDVSYTRGEKGDELTYWVAWAFSIGETHPDGYPVFANGCNVGWNQLFIPGDIDPVKEDNPAGVSNGQWASACEVITVESITYPDPDSGLSNSSSGIAANAAFEAVVQFGDTVHSIQSQSGAPTTVLPLVDAWFHASGPADSDHITMRTTSNCLGSSESRQCYDDINSGTYVVFGTQLLPEQHDYTFSYLGVV